MNKQELIEKLNQKHNLFIELLSSFSEKEFEMSYNGKWTAGQQLQHLLLSIKPISSALLIPRLLIKILFGKANRPGKTYQEIADKYQAMLNEGAKAKGAYIPKAVKFKQKGEIIQPLEKTLYKLSKQLYTFTENELDSIILPHPIMGKITVREMIYFTIYHVELHTEITKRNLNLDL